MNWHESETVGKERGYGRSPGVVSHHWIVRGPSAGFRQCRAPWLT